MLDAMPTVTLGSGLTVANFSSPHPFTFTTGEVLPACSEARSRALALLCAEEERPHPCVPGMVDLLLTWKLSAAVTEELSVVDAWYSESHRHGSRAGALDVCLVPFPVMEAIVAYRGWVALPFAGAQVRHSPFRVVRSADRVSKAIYPDRFCLKEV